MFKEYKKPLILSSLVTLLPMVVGLLLWNRFPDQMVIHWGFDGQPDGWGSIHTMVYALPLILLASSWLLFWLTLRDPGNRGKNRKPLTLVLWILPLVCNLCCGISYALALGVPFSITNLMPVFMGLLFAVIGNYMPKCSMNSTIGIKIRWAYTSEANWNATHRLAGRLWVIGGIAIAFCALLPSSYAFAGLFLGVVVMVTVPMVYSWLYWKKQKAAGTELKPFPKVFTAAGKFSALLLILLAIFLGVVMFTGNINVVFGEESFTIEASYYQDMTVAYSAVDSVEYRDGNVSGSRVSGYGSLRLLLGYFENEEFGYHTRYTYYSPDACVILTSGDRTLVLSGETVAETQAIYQTLLEKTQ